jgi:hypothetical protein
MAHKTDEREMDFRIGATHAAQWFRDIVRKMTASGSSNEEISARLGDLNQVLQDWRQNAVLQKDDFPEGNPWDWHQGILDDYIAQRRDEW